MFFVTDYNPASIPDTITIAAAADRECFTGMVINDILALEEEEQFRLTLSDPTPSGVTIGQATTTITIQDDDGRHWALQPYKQVHTNHVMRI